MRIETAQFDIKEFPFHLACFTRCYQLGNRLELFQENAIRPALWYWPSSAQSHVGQLTRKHFGIVDHFAQIFGILFGVNVCQFFFGEVRDQWPSLGSMKGQILTRAMPKLSGVGTSWPFMDLSYSRIPNALVLTPGKHGH